MPLGLNLLLEANKIRLSDVRLVRHKDTRHPAKARSLYVLWRDCRTEFETYQSRQAKEKHDTTLKAPFWASFVVTPADETLFVGLYQVGDRHQLPEDAPCPLTGATNFAQKTWVYDACLSEKLQDFVGRLVVDWGPGQRSWIQRADRQNKPITEVRRQFQEPDFPGYQKFAVQLSEIPKMPSGWAGALRASRGIYVLTCPISKEQYVGAAYGSEGFLGRFQEYAQNGHGGNIALKARPLSDYRVAILEVAGSASSNQDILEMEARWKSKLQSQEMGLNKN